MKDSALWLGFSVPDAVAHEIFSLDPLPAVQTHKFGWNFAMALSHAFANVVIASSCPVQNYPLVKRVIFFGGRFKKNGMNGLLIGFINIILLKHISRLAACFLTVTPLLRRHSFDWIFLHGIHTPFLLFGVFARLFGAKVAVVLTDPPGQLLPTDSNIARVAKRLDARFIRFLLRRFDAVIALAPDLATKLAPGVPSLIFPGIMEKPTAPSEKPTSIPHGGADSPKPFTMVYAGSLNRAYGVDLLLDAFRGLTSTRQPILLKLFGRGDMESIIQRDAAIDSRVVYGGFLSPADLQAELLHADLLINPRPTKELFASMSFPSKLIEYLATGIPVMTTRLSSIPPELSEHFYYIQDESAMGIRSAIQEFIEKSSEERITFGITAMKAVHLEYSQQAIGSKISQFLKSI